MVRSAKVFRPLFFASVMFGYLTSNAQIVFNDALATEASTLSDISPTYGTSSIFDRKLFQRNTGIVIGLQRGRYTAIELGGEAHWRKVSLLKPRVVGATANLEYNFNNNVVGYKAGMWTKRGHINLTYGANISYYTDFKDNQKFGIGPAVGFRFLGLHLINGYNFLTGNNSENKQGATPTALPVNTLYMSIRYYIPVENKFVWDRKTRKKIKERKKERTRKKEQREKDRESGEKKGLRKLFDFSKKDKKDSQPP